MVARTKFIVIVILILSIFLGVGFYINKLGNQYVGPPSLTVSEEIADLGTINQDKPVKYVFTLKNEGGEPLIIDRIQAPCSCTATALSEEKLLSGKTTKLEVTFNPIGFSGAVTHSVYIYSNDEKNPRKKIAIKANVEHLPSPKIVLSNNRWDFGLLSNGETSTHQVNIYNEGDLPLVIENIVLPMEVKFNIEIPVFPVQLEPGDEKELNFIFDSSGQEEGVFNEYIRMVTNDPYKRNLTLRMEGYIKDREEVISVSFLKGFIISPFSEIEDKIYETDLLIKNNSDINLNNIFITPSENYIKLSMDEISLSPGEEKLIKVSIEEESLIFFEENKAIQNYIYINIPVPLNISLEEIE